MRSERLLWAGLLTSPIAWFICLEANFALAPLACHGRGKAVMYVVTGLALLLSLASGLPAWMQFSVAAAKGAAPTRRHRMAIAGIALSSLFTLVITAQAIPTIMFSGCE